MPGARNVAMTLGCEASRNCPRCSGRISLVCGQAEESEIPLHLAMLLFLPEMLGLHSMCKLRPRSCADGLRYPGVDWLASAFVPTGSAILSEVILPPVKVAIDFSCHNKFRMVQAWCFEGLEHIWYGQSSLTGAAFHAKAAC
ncbi:hypothetical protein Nepgr_020376 [Nepenthes gracilis]|uniref:Uncharacterized protein n=1 Tax=Nepenthes gracilis TaxID=150966 RepID=A0AAD3SWR0_NEPGR|nr:hypothetical protein Nepgr_020376 [Nepenthes gracilis]